jgi:2-C-methyl-D-erythritol 2,4-cyclodiphosphate synthase
MSALRIGHGFDTHALVPGRPLVLGGVVIPHDRGLEGHSDGDVLLHAVASALLGALGEGDLGAHFPSSDPALRGVASRELVARVVAILRERRFALGNLDATLVAQVPRLAPHLEAMRAAIAKLLEADLERVNVKATSTDHLGHLGRGEGIAAFAVVLIEPAS